MYPNCDKIVCLTPTEKGYKIPLFCCLCLLGKAGIPRKKRAACIDKCPNIEKAKLGAIV
jgi:hypothetical protein